MVKKSLIAGLTAIILSLCCGLCFAAEGEGQNSIHLGNEITKSIDKAGQSIENVTDDVFSGNTAKDMKDGARNAGDDVRNGVRDVGNGIDNGTRDIMGDQTGNYNTTRTTTEGTTATGLNTMSTTTWMWIILAVAAIIIIAAIWYYATQNND